MTQSSKVVSQKGGRDRGNPVRMLDKESKSRSDWYSRAGKAEVKWVRKWLGWVNDRKVVESESRGRVHLIG